MVARIISDALKPANLSSSTNLVVCAFAMILIAVVSSSFYAGGAFAQSSVRPPANATVNAVPRAGTPTPVPGRRGVAVEPLEKGNVPGGALGNRSQSDIWRVLREGKTGKVSIPDNKAGQLIRGTQQRLKTEADIRKAVAERGAAATRGPDITDGSIMSWVEFRRGPLATYGAYAIGATVLLLVIFFLIRGRIRVEHGLSGELIQRFGSFERMGHWLLAISFIVLALTGLNLLYGRQALIPLLGAESYANIAFIGKLTHNYIAFAFMVGLVLVFVNWIRHNLPHPRDLIWLAKGGGVLVKGVHPSSKKFNAGQKILFWLVILGGISISLSGLALMFPFQTAMFAKTFVFLNSLGFNLPTEVSPIQEMQYQSLWHAVAALFMICLIIAHIYIGSVGMQGAIDTMTTGEVDVNWAHQHHDLWLEEELAKQREAPADANVQPAE